MTDEQSDINGDIQSIRCALDGLEGYSVPFTPENIKLLSTEVNRIMDFLIKITEKKDD